ncbi:DUF1269 domain-containing protein [Deinococcus budaensis]|uniref:Putative membrane protein n=1 Tax=Deinococcus budaensis TaxID=1665626 RepID=A0A7W8LQI4_9DEIO|nr:DUF1269 domain-containing protein [Deinococcus budaensis]MBB5234635.1 putative membrane protein [Deinococcus budaensis]
MADARPFRYQATFQDPGQAKDDFAAVSALHRTGLLGTYGAALITRDPGSGEVWLSTRALPAERSAVLGAVLGLLLGRLLRASLLLSAAAGALAGGVTGHLRAGLPRRELQALAATLAPGESAVVVVGESRLEEALRQAGERAARRLARRREEVRQINRQGEEAAQRTGA